MRGVRSGPLRLGTPVPGVVVRHDEASGGGPRLTPATGLPGGEEVAVTEEVTVGLRRSGDARVVVGGVPVELKAGASTSFGNLATVASIVVPDPV